MRWLCEQAVICRSSEGLYVCALPLQLSQPFGPLLSVQREMVCLICSHLHQVFIGNPTVAKLVHFQVSSDLSSLVCVCSHDCLNPVCVCGSSACVRMHSPPFPSPPLPSPPLPVHAGLPQLPHRDDGGGSAIHAHLSGLHQ